MPRSRRCSTLIAGDGAARERRQGHAPRPRSARWRESSNPSTKTLLLPLLEERRRLRRADADVRAAARAVAARDRRPARLGRARSASSSPASASARSCCWPRSGLAITYGLMGVINMAHGELIMIGAYATYVVQNLFRAYLPGAFDWYLLAAMPGGVPGRRRWSAWCSSARVIRWLYGRPLETLLATWGISLMLIQAVRTIFGAQNVQVENPAWMSRRRRGADATWCCRAAASSSSSSRASSCWSAWLLLTRTRLGLFVRGVTQNRAMAACMGVPTRRASTSVRSPSARASPGLAGCALSQIGNVGPDLGQSYIVDSFMVVVLGGVGQLAGTVYAALGLGVAQQVARRLAGRGAREDRGAGVHHHLHPEAAAGPVRAQGPERRRHERGSLTRPCRRSARARCTRRARLLAGGWRRSSRSSSLLVVVPSLNLLRAARAARSTCPTTAVALVGKIMCYAIVRAGDGPDLGLHRHPVARPRPVLRARRLRDGHVPDAPDRPRRQYQQRPAGLHGVPRLEGVALVLELHRSLLVRSCCWSCWCRACWPSCSASSRSARASRASTSRSSRRR